MNAGLVFLLIMAFALWASMETWKAQRAAWEYPRGNVQPNPIRKLLHMSLIVMVLPAIQPGFNKELVPLLWMVGFLIGRFIFPLPFMRAVLWSDAEGNPYPEVGVLAFPLVMFWVTLFLRPEAGVILLSFLAIGDGLASLVGRPFGRHRLPWNPDKSWAGTLSFLIGGILACTLIVANSNSPNIPVLNRGWIWWTSRDIFHWPLWLMPFILTAAESWPSKWDDNLRIGLGALIGWGIYVLWEAVVFQ